MMIAPQRTRSTCTFCRCGCALEIVRQGRRIVGVEYPDDSRPTGGRLCPRGSASAMLLDHPRRLCYPLKDGKERSWNDFLAEVGPIVRDCPSNELAITYGSQLTREDVETVWGMADALGADNLACSSPESEMHFARRLGGRSRVQAQDQFHVTPEEIAKADSLLLVGDVFGLMPVLARTVLDTRYASRERRLFGLDTVASRVAGFSHKFLQPRPGTEPLLVLGLAALCDPRLSGFDADAVATACGARSDDMREVATAFDRPKRGMILATVTSGRVANPQFLAAALQLLKDRMKGNTRLVVLSAGAIEPGKKPLGEILSGIEQGAVRVMLDFGDGALLEYPALSARLEKLELLVTTGFLRPGSTVKGWVLPVPMNLEKAGSVDTLWGPAKLEPTAVAASGTRELARIVEEILQADVQAAPVEETVWPAMPTRTVLDKGRAMLSGKSGQPLISPDYMFTLLAEKPAYGFLEVFGSSGKQIAVAPTDARALNLSERAVVKLETSSGRQATFELHVTSHVQQGTLLVDANAPAVRALFDVSIDSSSGMVTIPPAQAKLWRKE